MKTSQLINLLNAFLESDGDHDVYIKIQANDSFDTILTDQAKFVQYTNTDSFNISITGNIKN